MALRIPKNLRRIMQQISPPGIKPIASALSRGLGYKREVDPVSELMGDYKKKGLMGAAGTVGKELLRGLGGFAYRLPEVPTQLAIEGFETRKQKEKLGLKDKYPGLTMPETTIVDPRTGKKIPLAYERKAGLKKAKATVKKQEEAFRENIVSPEKSENLFAYQLGSGIGSLSTAVLLSAATGNPAAATMMFGLQAKTHAYKEARELGRAPIEAGNLSSAAGLTEGGLEYAGLQHFMKPSKGLVGIAKKSLIEGSQEAFQEIGSNFWAQASGDVKRRLTQDVAMSALIGGILGAGAGTVMPTSTNEVMTDRLVRDYGLKMEEAKHIVANIIPRIENSPAVARISEKLAEERGAVGKQKPKESAYVKGQKKAKYKRFTDPVEQDIRDTRPDLGSGEQLKLLYEGLREYKRKGKAPKPVLDYLKEAGVKQSDIVTPGLVSKIRPARKIFAKLSSDLYHAVYEPFTTAENARNNWVIKRLDEVSKVWKGANKNEINRIGIHAIQRDNLANGRDINYKLGKGVQNKFKVSEDSLFTLTEREQAYYNNMRNWFNQYQEAQYERIARRPEYFPGLADDSVMRSILTLYPGRGEIPSDILSFATKMRKEAEGVNRNINSVEVMKRYVSAEANDLYFGNLMKPMQQVVKGLKAKGKTSAADYVQNYTERMVGFPGQLDRELMTVMERVDKSMGWKADPQRILKASQAIIDLQYMGGLGIKPSTAIRNLVQLLHTGSEIGYKWSLEGTTEALTNWEKWAKEAQKAGVMQKVIPDVTAKGGRKHVQDIMLKLFETTETVNRVITYASAAKKWDAMWSRYGAQGNIKKFRKKADLAGFDKPIVETINKHISKGELHKARRKYARELTANTQYLYQKGEAPAITRTQLGKQGWVFQTWWENYLEMFSGWIKHKQWKNVARYLLLTVAAIKLGDEFGLDIASWIGASPIPELGRPERYPIVSAPAVRVATQAANIPLQAVLAAQSGEPMWDTPEGQRGKVSGAIDQFTKTLPILAPAGTFAQQMIRIAGEKRQPIEAFLPIHRARGQKKIKQEMIRLNDMHRRGTISTAEKYRRFNKLKVELARRKKEQPQRRKK